MSQAPPHIAAVIGSLQIYEFMLLSSFVSYVCCWFVTPKHRVRLYENRVLCGCLNRRKRKREDFGGELMKVGFKMCNVYIMVSGT